MTRFLIGFAQGLAIGAACLAIAYVASLAWEWIAALLVRRPNG